ncbi:unnamed protein product [Cuscuta europaea]|uniref:Uncharacterized protein n=1 Tax=Cuscuta europaea TaxID=41803 RepID=A0A9P0YVY1_CUSEU|nr:unnamed protein product [Cuscuta europaea]
MWDGVSTFICLKIVEILWKSTKRFNIQTLYILNDNTIYDREGNAYPLLKGFLVETGKGSIFPATFHETTKGPDEYIRSIRERASLRDLNWKNRFLETYDTESDQFVIAHVSSDLEELFQVPDWEKVFPFRRPRIFFRSNNGGWTMRTLEHVQIIKRTAGKR